MEAVAYSDGVRAARLLMGLVFGVVAGFAFGEAAAGLAPGALDFSAGLGAFDARKGKPAALEDGQEDPGCDEEAQGGEDGQEEQAGSLGGAG
jgi:hypothetical protein